MKSEEDSIFTVYGKYYKNRITQEDGSIVLAAPYSREDYNNCIGWFNLKKTNSLFHTIIQFVPDNVAKGE